MLFHRQHGQAIALPFEAHNLANAARSGQALVTNLFALMRIAQMYLNAWHRFGDRRDRIGNRQARVRVGGWVNNDPIIDPARCADAGNQCSLRVTLEKFELNAANMVG